MHCVKMPKSQRFFFFQGPGKQKQRFIDEEKKETHTNKLLNHTINVTVFLLWQNTENEIRCAWKLVPYLFKHLFYSSNWGAPSRLCILIYQCVWALNMLCIELREM